MDRAYVTSQEVSHHRGAEGSRAARDRHGGTCHQVRSHQWLPLVTAARVMIARSTFAWSCFTLVVCAIAPAISPMGGSHAAGRRAPARVRLTSHTPDAIPGPRARAPLNAFTWPPFSGLPRRG